jgi:hypothetical protein
VQKKEVTSITIMEKPERYILFLASPAMTSHLLAETAVGARGRRLKLTERKQNQFLIFRDKPSPGRLAK